MNGPGSVAGAYDSSRSWGKLVDAGCGAVLRVRSAVYPALIDAIAAPTAKAKGVLAS